MNIILEKAKENMVAKEILLASNAFKSKDGKTFREDTEDIRPIFFRDIDKIIHTLSYTRYIDKTQVYSFEKNDHITRRAIHVQLVSKIGKTIGRALRLNEDLIEAISLGHDIGHSPFGHTGETLLNEICEKEGIGFFCHNAQSVRLLKDIENANISIQTLDGILAHNGEILLERYEYNPNKTQEKLLEEINNVFNIKGYNSKIVPMTLEGCVVKISDVIAYIGRDIEDAIIVGSIKREDIPDIIVKTLGNNNSDIINTLIIDLIENSFDKNYLMFSKNIFSCLEELLAWNYEYIYNSKEANKKQSKLKELFENSYQFYLKKVKEVIESEGKLYKNNNSFYEKIFYEYIKNSTDTYLRNTDIKRIAIDYIAGQTDEFFLNDNKI